jgi:hypothetical protein
MRRPTGQGQSIPPVGFCRKGSERSTEFDVISGCTPGPGTRVHVGMRVLDRRAARLSFLVG